MKSPTTLIKLHERAIRYQEMIKYAEFRSKTKMSDARRYRKAIGISPWMISKCVERARRDVHIRNYLVTRYESLITKLN